MCGRYASVRSRQQLAEAFHVAQSNADEVPRRDYNVAPTKTAPVVLTAAPQDTQSDTAAVRQLRLSRWGLVPPWAKDAKRGINNARAETVHEKPSFRRAFAHRRCLIPADGFYEWFPIDQAQNAGKPLKQPYFLRPTDGSVLAMAGIYEYWRSPDLPDDDPHPWIPTFTIITTTATDDVGHLHERMPMAVTPEHWDAWLDPALSAVDDVRALMAPPARGSLEIFPVSTAVNNVRNNGPHLLDPAEATIS
jgi:putative SOS response-associated peptidase YedK